MTLRLRLYANSTASSSSAPTSTTTDVVKAQSEYRARPMSMWSVFIVRFASRSIHVTFLSLRIVGPGQQALGQPLELVAPA